MRCRSSTSLAEYSSGETRIGIVNRGAPSPSFGKSLDLFVSFSRPEFFPWPAALELILKYHAERSFFERPLDMFSERLKMPP